MKKWLTFVIIATIFVQFLMGCSTSKSVDFKQVYAEVIGFSDNDEKAKPIDSDEMLMMTNEEYQKFKDKNISPRGIPMQSPDKEKAVVFIQVPSKTSSVNTYSVKSVKVSNNTLTVNLKKTSVAEVDGKSGFNGTWKWVMLVELDKTDLKDNMKVVIKK